MFELTEHQKTEIERLEAGYDSCSCDDCQKLYQIIDLSKYGSRVIRFQGVICVLAGRTGADKWGRYHQGDNGTAFKNAASKPSKDNQGVLHHSVEGIMPVPMCKTPNSEQQHVIKHAGGRPRKVGEVSRWTIQRRQKEQQGVLTWQLKK